MSARLYWAPRRRKPKPAPLFVNCQRPGCEAVRQVRNRYEQRTRKYCSRRCVGLMHRPFTREERQRAAAVARQQRRAKAVQRVKGLTALEAYRLGFRNGWRQGFRARQRKHGAAA